MFDELKDNLAFKIKSLQLETNNAQISPYLKSLI